MGDTQQESGRFARPLQELAVELVEQVGQDAMLRVLGVGVENTSEFSEALLIIEECASSRREV